MEHCCELIYLLWASKRNQNFNVGCLFKAPLIDYLFVTKMKEKHDDKMFELFCKCLYIVKTCKTSELLGFCFSSSDAVSLLWM